MDLSLAEISLRFLQMLVVWRENRYSVLSITVHASALSEFELNISNNDGASSGESWKGILLNQTGLMDLSLDPSGFSPDAGGLQV